MTVTSNSQVQPPKKLGIQITDNVRVQYTTASEKLNLIVNFRNIIWSPGVVIFLCIAATCVASDHANAFAEIQFQNEFDQPLDAQCSGAYGMYKVLSVHSDTKEDRVWNWKCRQVVDHCHPKCYLTDTVNNFDQPMFFMCAKNHYIGGVHSDHSNFHEDRKWKFSCCSATGYITAACRLTEYVNEFDGTMNFEAGPGEVITGVFSYHSNVRE